MIGLKQIADDRVAITVGSTAEGQVLANHLRGLPGCVEAVGGTASVECQFDLAVTTADSFRAAVRRALGRFDQEHVSRGALHEITVVYGGAAGPDLDAVCRALDLTTAEFVRRHTEREYRVAMLGFTPGFAYLDGMAPSLACPRRDTPRRSVAAGSVGIAGARTGIYALDGPGGWQIVGRTTVKLFEPGSVDPFRLGAGDRVRFLAAEE